MERDYHKLKAAILNDNIIEIKKDIKFHKEIERLKRSQKQFEKFIKKIKNNEKLYNEKLITKKELRKQVSKMA